MSHYTVVKTKLKNRSHLKKALKRMALAFEEGDFTITQYGTTSKANIKFDNAVGLKQEEDGTWSMVGDFYHSRGKLRDYYGKNAEFNSDLSTAYAIEEAKSNLEDQGFYLSENTEAKVGSDGMITLEFSR